MRSLAVTTDFSEASKRSFGAAGELATRFGALVYLVYVAGPRLGCARWRDAPDVESPEGDAGVRRELERRLTELAASSAELEGVEVRPRVLTGQSADALRRFQERAGVELLVIGSHGHSNLEGFALGGFTSKALQLLTCPVLVCRTAKPSPRVPFHRIFSPYDFSSNSRLALETSRVWAQTLDAAVRVHFVVEEPEPFEGVEEEARARLCRALGRGWEGIDVDTRVTRGHPVVELLAQAREFDASLIILGGRGHTILPRLHLGSVVERVVQGAPCPVLVVKPLIVMRSASVPARETTFIDESFPWAREEELNSV